MKTISHRNVVNDFELTSINEQWISSRISSFPGLMILVVSLTANSLTNLMESVLSLTLWPTKMSATDPRAPTLFIDLQREGIGLKRFPLSSSLGNCGHTDRALRGELHTSSSPIMKTNVLSADPVQTGFAVQLYRICSVEAFDGAPDAILRDLGRLSWATEQAVLSSGDSYMPPNELLTWYILNRRSFDGVEV
ncbi:hypothetical protein N7535_007423 [Penicillium sp. DV-2018c]|nr:hypothetical protein N7535_007423 [Penicillium sp. DV-2018c]